MWECVCSCLCLCTFVFVPSLYPLNRLNDFSEFCQRRAIGRLPNAVSSHFLYISNNTLGARNCYANVLYMQAMTSEVWGLGVQNLVWRKIKETSACYVLIVFIKLRVSNIFRCVIPLVCVCIYRSIYEINKSQHNCF
jgi:hypothetical protein